MIRDCLLAPDRTITQCRDTDRTQRDTGRFAATFALVAVDATEVVGFAVVLTVGGTGSTVRGGATTSVFGAGVGATATGAMTAGVVSAIGREAMLSFAAFTARAIATSLSSGVTGGVFASAFTAAFGRGGGAFFEAAF